MTHGSLHHEAPQIRYLAESLDREGWAVDLIGPINSEVEIPGVVIYRVRTDRWGRVCLPIQGLWREFRNQYDCVIGIDEVGAMTALLSSLFRRQAFRVIYFLDFFDDLKLSRIYAPARWVIRRFSCRANMIVDANEHRCALRKQTLGKKNHYLTIHNCPPLGKVQRDKAIDPIFATAPAGVVRIVYTGTIAQNACLEPIIQAVKLVKQPVCLYIIGNDCNPYGTQLRKIADPLVKSNRCKFVGFVPRSRLFSILTGADIGLALYGTGPDTCLNEQYCSPNKLYEYMASGLPAVASTNPSLISLVQANNWGLCVDPGNPESIASALDRLASDAGLRAAFSRRAFELHATTMNFDAQVHPLLTGILGADGWFRR